MTSTQPDIMPSIRGRRARAAKVTHPRTTEPSRPWFALSLVGLIVAGGVAFLVWPEGDHEDELAATPPDAGPVTEEPPAIATPAKRPTFFGGTTTAEPEPPSSPTPPTSSPRSRGFSLRSAVRKQPKDPPPEPGEMLCTMPANHVMGLKRIMAITTDLGLFETFENPNRACGRRVAIAIERGRAGIVVNGLTFDGRAACFPFPTSVIEIEDTPDRSYAAWILPQGGAITACPASTPLSTLSRAKRTPRQPSSHSPPSKAPNSPWAKPPASDATKPSSSGGWNDWSGSP